MDRFAKGNPVSWVHDLATPDDVFVDVGASVGTVTQAAVERGVREIHAYEPDDRSAKKLLQRAQTDPTWTHVRVHPCAVGMAMGRSELFIADREGESSLTRELTPAVEVGMLVDVIRLDDAHDHIDLLKIDAQGMDMQVLHGASRLLRTVRSVCFECWPHGWETVDAYASVDDCWHLLMDSGLTVRTFSRHSVSLVQWQKWFNRASDRHHCNVMATR